MSDDSSRRIFLKQSATLVSGVALTRCAPGPQGAGDAADLDAPALDALAELVLPLDDLGADGVRRVVEGFRRWSAGFEAAAELNHGYGSAELRYGPPDPRPRWAAQLEALDLESRRRHDRAFAALPADERGDLLRRQLDRAAPGSLPSAGRAEHVAVGLLAYFYAGSEATDLCYGRRIGRETCQGLDTLPQAPPPLEGEA